MSKITLKIQAVSVFLQHRPLQHQQNASASTAVAMWALARVRQVEHYIRQVETLINISLVRIRLFLVAQVGCNL